MVQKLVRGRRARRLFHQFVVAERERVDRKRRRIALALRLLGLTSARWGRVMVGLRLASRNELPVLPEVPFWAVLVRAPARHHVHCGGGGGGGPDPPSVCSGIESG